MKQSDAKSELMVLDRKRWLIASVLTGIMIGAYFGFILLVAFHAKWMGARVASGLSWGILLAAGLILLAWILTFIYVKWANNIYDPQIARLREARNKR